MAQALLRSPRTREEMPCVVSADIPNVPTIPPAELSALLDSLYEGATENPPWRSFLELLREQLDCSHATLILRPPAQNWSGVMINAGHVSTEGLASYNTHFFALDPFIGLPENQVVTAAELLGEQAWRENAFYREFVEPHGILHILGADLKVAGGIDCRLRLCRGADDVPFSPYDKAVCRQLLSHLRRAVKMHSTLGQLEVERQMYAGAVDRMLIGTIVLNERGDIIKINRHGQEILAEADGLKLVKGHLQAEYGQEHRELQRLIKQALQQHNGGRGSGGPSVVEAISLTRPSGNGKIGVLVRAAPEDEWSDSAERPAVVIFLRDPESRSQPSHEIVMRLFDLTPSEAVLATLLADGMTLDEASDEMGIRRNTVRAHLRSIFSKTGVTRQTTLVRVLLNSVVTLG
ncbi:helix-turn-helix transcriptional regulator [Crenobacter sp. SG2305]|uniref:helix-turn-helix transcriptional regulator n=1 Tax=Crenobacter oryzisoli TaxID=3056844 RepID=UPI0025AAC4EA|nr:helix-turn-helix transcriptional regulator [Crenobacter sp. SG2305]MDN0085595.1 helix-turn-helix transcriptional regulator [Crenobacter sp. SG2305]